MENSAYMESIVAVRAQGLSEEEQLAGEGMISVETQQEFNDDSFYSYCAEHFAAWLKLIRTLPSEQQELLLCYYLLGKTQSLLAKIFVTTQTVCSFRIRMAVKLAGTFLLLGGVPTAEVIHPILLKAGLENKLPVPLSHLIAEYAECRDFSKMAYRHKLHRPDIRRAMSEASKILLGKDDGDQHVAAQATDPEGIALGAYIFALIDKANPQGSGKSKREVDKTARAIVRCDPAIVGEFRINCNDPDFEHMFVSRASF
jgi:hypothetical protein